MNHVLADRKRNSDGTFAGTPVARRFADKLRPEGECLGTVADNNRDRHSKGRTVMPTNGPDFWRSKTHCPQGHAYSGDNVRYRKDGRRRCAACYRERARAVRAARRGL